MVYTDSTNYALLFDLLSNLRILFFCITTLKALWSNTYRNVCERKKTCRQNYRVCEMLESLRISERRKFQHGGRTFEAALNRRALNFLEGRQIQPRESAKDVQVEKFSRSRRKTQRAGNEKRVSPEESK